MEQTKEIMELRRDLNHLKEVVEHLKEVVAEQQEEKEMEEIELTDWAKEQLEGARKTPRSEYISHEEVKRKILAKK